ncbi:MAG: hypothetical protein JWM14_1060 [Chitinophagaceae bacterium]|nr:hypothetical protein [Chitinophagaceae bacterium]
MFYVIIGTSVDACTSGILQNLFNNLYTIQLSLYYSTPSLHLTNSLFCFLKPQFYRIFAL